MESSRCFCSDPGFPPLLSFTSPVRMPAAPARHGAIASIIPFCSRRRRAGRSGARPPTDVNLSSARCHYGGNRPLHADAPATSRRSSRSAAARIGRSPTCSAETRAGCRVVSLIPMHGPFPCRMRSTALVGRSGDIPRRRRLSCACRPGAHSAGGVSGSNRRDSIRRRSTAIKKFRHRDQSGGFGRLLPGAAGSPGTGRRCQGCQEVRSLAFFPSTPRKHSAE